jgi:hypothetical protein
MLTSPFPLPVPEKNSHMKYSQAMAWIVVLATIFWLYVLGAPVLFIATHRSPREIPSPPYMKPYEWLREQGPEDLMRAYEAWWIRYYRK